MKKSMHLQEARAESIFTATLLVTYLLRDKKKDGTGHQTTELYLLLTVCYIYL